MAIAFVVVATVMTVGYEARASYRSNAFCKNVGEYGDPAYKKNVFKRRVFTKPDGTTQYTFTHAGAIPGSQYHCSVEVAGDKVVGTRVSHVRAL
ncbi:MAG TPA: hypothetical protein VKD04_14315 [Burkholderiales bacterium]|nr:hypothetical protein [Burkholderiales bacterium]